MAVILDLCGGSGAWSKPYRDAGYTVCLLTLPAVDVRLLTVANIKKIGWPVQGILAAPPCTVFARCGARWKRHNWEMIDGLSVVDACLRLVQVVSPSWWALENPIGKLIRYLGKPRLRFNPCDYGDPYTKQTLLWGSFTIPEQTPVEPTLGSKMHCANKKIRSITPAGFARAFFQANP